MTAPFQIDVDDREVRTLLERLSQRMGNLTPAMENIGRALGNRTEDSFQGERSPFGPPWQRLSADYVRRPVAKGGRGGDVHPILQRDGGLAGSLTHGGNRTSAWVGVSKIYAALHQFGGTPEMPPGPRAVPARPFLPIDQQGNLPDGARDEVLEILSDYLRR